MGLQSQFRSVAAGAAMAASAFAATVSAAQEIPATETQSWTIPVEGRFDEETVSAVIEKLSALRKQDITQKITLDFQDIAGGSAEQGFKLAQAIYEAGNVDLACSGNLQSMAATVFVAYQGGKRIATPDCTNFMMHDLITNMWSMGSGTMIVRTYAKMVAQNLDVAMDIMSRATAKASGMPLDSARALFGEDCNLTPEKAYKLGLVDAFEDAGKDLPPRMKNITPSDIYSICETQPLESYLPPLTDWRAMNFGALQEMSAKP